MDKYRPEEDEDGRREGVDPSLLPVPYEPAEDEGMTVDPPPYDYDEEDDGATARESPKKRDYMRSLTNEEIELEMENHVTQTNTGLLNDDKTKDEETDFSAKPPIADEEDSDNMETAIDDEEPQIAPYNFAAKADGDDVSIPETWSPSGQEPQRRRSMDMMEMEDARARSDDEETDCSWAGPFSCLCEKTSKCVRRRNLSRARVVLIVAAIVIVFIGIVLFLSIFPQSWVYLQYDLIALERNKWTNSVNRDRTFYPGAYCQGPEAEFIRFNGTVHSVDLSLDIATADELSITIDVNIQYFIKPPELGILYGKFGLDYEKPVELLMKAAIKNLAIRYTLDEYRLKRLELEDSFRRTVKKELGGDCCPACCAMNKCADDICSWCQPKGKCFIGRHIDVRFFNLLTIDPPATISERYMQKILLDIHYEREFHIQEKIIVDKKTQREVLKLHNAADLVIANATAYSDYKKTIAEVNKEIKVQEALVSSLRTFYKTLNVIEQPHKVSLMLIRALEDMDNLFLPSYNYEKQTLLTF